MDIAEAFPEDEGDYTCRAENEYGTTETTAELVVRGKIYVNSLKGSWGALWPLVTVEYWSWRHEAVHYVCASLRLVAIVGIILAGSSGIKWKKQTE